jgi:hypothetical protein
LLLSAIDFFLLVKTNPVVILPVSDLQHVLNVRRQLSAASRIGTAIGYYRVNDKHDADDEYLRALCNLFAMTAFELWGCAHNYKSDKLKTMPLQ